MYACRCDCELVLYIMYAMHGPLLTNIFKVIKIIKKEKNNRKVKYLVQLSFIKTFSCAVGLGLGNMSFTLSLHVYDLGLGLAALALSLLVLLTSLATSPSSPPPYYLYSLRITTHIDI